MRRRIAIYGGTFDPVHVGHLQIARKVSELFAIDEFLFVPARRAPHKSVRPVSSALDRYAMLVLATAAEQNICVSRYELERPEHQYTVDTLTHFRSGRWKDADLFFVMGADSWAEITSWREWQRLVTLSNFIVVTRPGVEFSADDTTAAVLQNQIRDLRGAQMKVLNNIDSKQTQIFITDAVNLDVSATAVREAARNKNEEDLKQLVPPEVADYIRKYGLYRNTNEA